MTTAKRRIALHLRLDCADPSVAGKLGVVLGPDNRSVPSDQRFMMRQEAAALSFSIESDRAASAFTSLDSVLSDAALFQEVWLLSRRDEGREAKEN